MSKMQAVNLGWDIGRPGGDKMVYCCRECGPSETPSRHIDAYFKSQVREAEQQRIKEFEDGRVL